MGKTEMEALAMDEEEQVPPPAEGMRYAGLCRDCKDFVELDDKLNPRDCGHTKDRIAVALLLGESEPLPHLPKMNWGAFFMPALWGPGHGQWYLILMYPILIFLDNIVYTAVQAGGLYILLAVACLVCMLAFLIVYVRGANMAGYLRVSHAKTVDEYLKGEKRWTWAMIAVAVVFIVFATYYNIAVRPGVFAG